MGSELYCVAALPDGVHFVVGLGAGVGEVRLYHVDGTLVHTFEGHDRSVNALAVTRDGQHIISGSSDTLVKVWSVATKSLVSTCEGHTNGVLAVAAMPDGQRILSGSVDGPSACGSSMAPSRTPSGCTTGWVRALVALPDNQHALSSDHDGTVKLFNVNDGAVLRTFRHTSQTVRSLALLPDGLRFVSASYDKTARIAYHGLAPQKP